MKRLVILFILALGIFLVNLNSVSAATWYVSNTNPSCNDAGPGTLATPLCNISSANTRHVGGDTVYIMPGEYRESYYCGVGIYGGAISGNSTICPKSGSPGNPTIFSGYGDRSQVKIMGSDPVTGWTQCNAVSCPGVSTNVYFANFEEPSLGGRCGAPGLPTDCWEDRLTNHKQYQPQASLADVNSPGEFWHNSTLDRVYVYTSNGANPNTHQIECSKRHTVMTPRGLSYFILQNFTIMHGHWNGVYISSSIENSSNFSQILYASDITIKDNDIGWNSGGGSCGENPSGIQSLLNEDGGPNCSRPFVNAPYYCMMKRINIIGNWIHDQGSDVGYSLTNPGNHRGAATTLYTVGESLIANNTVWNNYQGIMLKERNINNTIRGNTIFNISHSGIHFRAGSHSMLVDGNVIYIDTGINSEGAGISWYGNDWCTTHCCGSTTNCDSRTDNMTVLHNTIWDITRSSIGGAGIRFDDHFYESGSGNWRSSGHFVKNNFIGKANFEITSSYWNPSGNFTSDNNSYYEISGSSVFGRSYATPISISEWQTVSSYDATGQAIIGRDKNSLFLTSANDPLFVDVNNYDFGLNSNSPLIDKGQWIQGYHCTSAGPNSSGCREWYGSAPDIGAYEYNPGIPIVTCIQADVNDDLIINIIDLALVIYNQGQGLTGRGHLDINTDGLITFNDVSEVRNRLGQVC